MKKLSAGAAPNDGKGTKAPSAVEIINENATETLRYMGLAGREVWAQAGDSMMGNASANEWSSLFAVIRMLHHDFNAIIDGTGYYNPDTEIVKPVGERGFNFGKGGTTVAHLRKVQLPFILQALDDGAIFSTIVISPLQNDRFDSLDAAKKVLIDLLYVVDILLARDIKIIMLGVWPQTGLIVNGDANAYGKHYCERALTLAAEGRPGFLYIPMLEALKTGIAAEEVAGRVNWRGVSGQVGGDSFDDIHSADGGARNLAPIVAPHIKRIVRAYHKPTFDALPFNQTKNPLGNIFGASGRFGGSGGTITNLADPDNPVTSPDVPAGLEIRYDASKGIILTPRLTGDPDEPFEIEISGVPTATQTFHLAILKSTGVYNPGGPVEMWGQVRLIDWEGLSGLGAGQVEIPDVVTVPIRCGIGSTGGRARVIPSKRSELVTLHSMAPAYYRNEYGTVARLGVGTTAIAGLSVGRSIIRFRRLGLFASVAA